VGSLLAKNFSNLTNLAIFAALKAGKILYKGFHGSFAISSKEGIHNLVTEYDLKAEKAIISLLKKGAPNSRFLAEEGGSTGNGDLLWVIDPLDGTVNFAHHIPMFSVSIALQIKDEITSGVVYLPITKELFVAEKGKGAFLNNKPIHVSSTGTLEESMLATGFPYNLFEDPFQCVERFVDILKLGLPIRRLGSAAIDLAYTATGRLDGFFEVGLKPWDSAAGALLIQEAGGTITGWDGSSFSPHSKTPIVATNGKIHQSLTNILQKSFQ